jgi:L-fuculose-phosphate aldolase
MDASLSADMKFRIAVARRMLYRHGLDSQIGGHVSLRVPGEDAFYVTPFQYFDECLPEHVSKVGFDLEVREAGTLPASPGINFHASIYRHRPDVQAAIHTHSDKISILSSSDKPFDAYYAPGAIFVDDIIAGVLGNKRAVFMKHHGAVHVGATLEDVVVETILLEKCANYQIEAMSIGARPLAPSLARAYRQTYLRNGFQRREWDAYLRDLKRSDPVLFKAA